MSPLRSQRRLYIAFATVVFTALGCNIRADRTASEGEPAPPQIPASSQARPEAHTPVAQIPAKKARASTLPADWFGLVVQAGGPHVVLHAAPEDTWAQGEPVLVSRGDPVVVRREVNVAALPQDMARARGQTVELYSDEGPICSVTLMGFTLLGRYLPQPDTKREWRGSTGEKPWTDADIATTVWGYSEGGHLLAADVSLEEGDCTGARFARPASDQSLPLAKATPASGKLRKAALREFRRLPAYREIQEEYTFYMEGARAGHWDEGNGANPVVQVMSFPARGEMLVSVSAENGLSSEDESMNGELFALWQVKEDASGFTFSLLNDPRTSPFAVPEAAMDIDGDGVFEILYHEGLLQKKGAGYDSLQELDIPTDEDSEGC